MKTKVKQFIDDNKWTIICVGLGLVCIGEGYIIGVGRTNKTIDTAIRYIAYNGPQTISNKKTGERIEITAKYV